MTRIKKGKEKALIEGEGLRKYGPIMGLDVHKDVIQYCIVTEKRILEEDELENTKGGLRKLVKIIKKRKVRSVAMESTSQYHVKVMYYLLENEIKMLVANPLQTKQTQGKKTDILDARRIAVAHRDGRLKASVIPHYDYWILRKAMRKLVQLINEATKSKQRLSQLFHQKDFNGIRLLKNKTGIDLLSLVINGAITREMISQIINRSTTRKLNFSEKDFMELKAFQEALKPMERITFGTELTQLRTNMLLQEQQQLIYVEMAKKDEQFKRNMELLLSIPGVGPDTAAIILSELADISYFDNPSSLAKWAGLAPKVYQSGHKKNITGKIHKGGNKYMRRAVVLAAQNIYAKAKQNPLHRWMRDKKGVRESKTHKSAYWLVICAGARKLLVYVYHILHNQCPWKFMEIPEEVIEKVVKYIKKKTKTFQKRVLQLEHARKLISEETTKIISGLNVPELSPKYLLYQIIKRPEVHTYT